MTFKILSFGAGVQTTALLFMIGKEMDYVVFADTGDEKPETYSYLELYVKPFCKKNNIKFITVTSHLGSLMEYSKNKKVIPIRRFRWCTHRFKIVPIRKFLRKVLGITRKDPCELYIGISYDEIERMNPSIVQYAINKYPLIDKKLTREDCYKIIKDFGYPIPQKSGCYYCPFSKKSDLIQLKKDHKDLFDKAVAMEKNGSQYPKFTLFAKPLEQLDLIEEIDDMNCTSGHCMV